MEGTKGYEERKISNRLNNFIEDHLEYQDIGGPESGPRLVADYIGPEWAMRLDCIAEGTYGYFRWESNLDIMDQEGLWI